MNTLGQVVSWKLTRDLSFSTVKSLFVELRDRLLGQDVHIAEFYVDNCCAWRMKWQSVFGSSMRVLLDIFHAGKRVGENIPKHHPLHVAMNTCKTLL